MNTEKLLLSKWRNLSVTQKQKVLNFIESISPQQEPTQWQYLEKKPHSRRQQLYLKGKRIKASVIYSDMMVNKMTPEEVADNWELPLAAIEEIIEYCQTHQQLLQQEANEARSQLTAKGVLIEPKITH